MRAEDCHERPAHVNGEIRRDVLEIDPCRLCGVVGDIHGRLERRRRADGMGDDGKIDRENRECGNGEETESDNEEFFHIRLLNDRV